MIYDHCVIGGGIVGCAAAYYPETNPLVPLDHTAEGSRTPASKSLVVRLVERGTSRPDPGGTLSGGAHRTDVEPEQLS